MQVREYVKCGRIYAGLEVTKDELLMLASASENNYIFVSKADMNMMSEKDGSEVVGAIFGHIKNIISDNKDTYKELYESIKVNGNVAIAENPDCRFVLNPENRGYKVFKELETEFTFGEAVELCKTVGCIARKGWNGNRKDNGEFNLRMFVIYVPSRVVTFRENTPYGDAGLAGKEMKIDAHLDLYTPAGTVQPGWLAAQPDTLATDWVVARRYKN